LVFPFAAANPVANLIPRGHTQPKMAKPKSILPRNELVELEMIYQLFTKGHANDKMYLFISSQGIREEVFEVTFPSHDQAVLQS
jgi:hypothetical protein